MIQCPNKRFMGRRGVRCLEKVFSRSWSVFWENCWLFFHEFFYKLFRKTQHEGKQHWDSEIKVKVLKKNSPLRWLQIGVHVTPGETECIFRNRNTLEALQQISPISINIIINLSVSKMLIARISRVNFNYNFDSKLLSVFNNTSKLQMKGYTQFFHG